MQWAEDGGGATTELTDTDGERDDESLVAIESESGSRFVLVMAACERGKAMRTCEEQ